MPFGGRLSTGGPDGRRVGCEDEPPDDAVEVDEGAPGAEGSVGSPGGRTTSDRSDGAFPQPPSTGESPTGKRTATTMPSQRDPRMPLALQNRDRASRRSHQ